MKKNILAIAVLLSLGTSAQALSINITAWQYYDANGTQDPSFNTGLVTVDLFNSALGGVAATPFFGPNSSSIHQAYWDETTGVATNWTGTNAQGSWNYAYTLSTGQVAVGLSFTYDVVVDVSILQIFDCSDGIVCTGVNNDTIHAGVPGTEMQNGPWPGQHITFSGLAVVPVPAAVWLFGSGLLALLGVARSRKAA